ncbi:N-acetyltransferase [bacterium]|nr:N-acetyltransferase [bacterium]
MGEIRKVDPARDTREIAEIYRWYVENTTASFELIPLSEEKMLQRIKDIASDFPYYVWEEGGNILGYCYAHRWKSFPAYDITLETTIYLRPEARGRGIGRRLMDKLIAECRAARYTSLIACITAENTESCRFHESLGFLPVSRFRNVGKKFGRLLDVVDYQKELYRTNALTDCEPRLTI